MDFIHDQASILTKEQIDILEDQRIENLFLLKSYWQLFAVIGSYLFFVLKLGPRLMKNRPPFDLKYVMVVYNIVQLWANSAFLVLSNKLPWIWLMMKILDLVDTVFFVLRKKQSHVTFLHIYHHTTLVISVWLYLRYVRGEQAFMIALVNCTVHFVMYLYYLLAALGPQVQKYLWWKKYVTKIQLVQFWILTAFYGTLLIACDLPPMQKLYNYWVVSQGLMFTGLFLNFYFRSYKKKLES